MPNIDINDPSFGQTLLLASACMFLLAMSMRNYLPVLRRTRRRPAPKGAHELEVRLRMSSGLAVLDDLQELAQLYLKARRYQEAEQYCKQALHIAESQIGKNNERLVPILKSYGKALKGMHREAEAGVFMKRAEHLSRAHK